MASLLRLIPSKLSRVVPAHNLNSFGRAGQRNGGHWNAMYATVNRFLSSGKRHRNIGISAHIDR